MGHWYTADGQPMHKVQAHNGSGLRPTTIRDARKLGLCPSVTEIIGMRDAPALTNWKIDQALMAAITLPRIEGETDDAFMARAKADSKREAIESAKIGGQIHDDIERVFRGVNTLEYHDIAKAAHAAIVEYTGISSGWMTEVPFASLEYGFGGRIDLIHPEHNIIVDYKTKNIKSLDAKMAYPNHCMQLSAYEVGAKMEDATLINVFVDRSEAGKLSIHEWDTKMFDRFLCLLKLWQLEKDYIPFKEAA